MIAQSMAIARFAAKEAGLVGSTNVIAAKADMIVDTVSDLINSE